MKQPGHLPAIISEPVSDIGGCHLLIIHIEVVVVIVVDNLSLGDELLVMGGVFVVMILSDGFEPGVLTPSCGVNCRAEHVGIRRPAAL